MVFSCSYVGPPATNSIATCNGQINLVTAWERMSGVSVAAFSFTTDAAAIIANTYSNATNPLFVPENTVVTATKGAWPRPEYIDGFDFQLFQVSARPLGKTL